MRQLLLIRPKPLADELFSSWIVRLAWANGQKLHPFTHKILGLTSRIWNKDPDRGVPADQIELIATVTGISTEVIQETTLSSYAKVVLDGNGRQWILPIGHRARYWMRPGLQICPVCLASDAVPYFRKRWRLAFVTCCVEHRVVLIDRCKQCNQPISPHTGDYKSKILRDEFSWVLCYHCGADFRQINTFPATNGAINTAKYLINGLVDQWIQIGERSVHSRLGFDGLHVLCRMLCSNTRSRRFAICVSDGMGELSFPSEFMTRKQSFEELEVTERHRIITMLNWLLAEWPTRFLWAGRRARLSKAYIRGADSDLPYWLSIEVEWELDGGYYVPNEDERQALLVYLERLGLSTAENNLRRWLGQSYVSGHKTSDPLAPRGKKWPGYAKMKSRDRIEPL
jgi:hypothetical protein